VEWGARNWVHWQQAVLREDCQLPLNVHGQT